MYYLNCWNHLDVEFNSSHQLGQWVIFNLLRQIHIGHRFGDNMFKCISCMKIVINWLKFLCDLFPVVQLTHWGRVTHICVSKLTIIGSDYGLSPGRRQAIIWTNAGILLIRTSGTNFGEILGEINSFLLSKMHLKMSTAKWCQFGLGLNKPAFVQIMDWCRRGHKSLSEPVTDHLLYWGINASLSLSE